MLKAESLKLRLRKLQGEIRRARLRGIIMVPGPNMRYYTDNQSKLLERPFLLFVPRGGRPHLLVPKLEAGPYRRTPLEIEIIDWDDSEGPSTAFRRLASKLELSGTWGCEGRVPFGYVSHLLKGRTLRLVNGEGALQSVREVKSDEELGHLRRAASILAKSYLGLLDGLKVGVSELELARRLTDEIFANGGESCDFCDVQSGPRAADPHSETSQRKLKKGEGLVVDAGCTYGGYNADITRTLVLGGSKELEGVYAAVLEAQERAVRTVRPSERVGAVDAAARGTLEKAGLGKYFIHRTGHGLGLEIHEAPFIVSGGRERLREGMALTVEPGVYIPRRLGVRIEDDVLVAKSGREVITGALPKEYGWWR